MSEMPAKYKVPRHENVEPLPNHPAMVDGEPPLAYPINSTCSRQRPKIMPLAWEGLLLRPEVAFAMKRSDFARSYAFRFRCLADSIRQLFKRRNRVDPSFFCVHTQDSAGNPIHFLCRKRPHDGDDQVAR